MKSFKIIFCIFYNVKKILNLWRGAEKFLTQPIRQFIFLFVVWISETKLNDIIIQGFQTIVFIVIVIFTTFWPSSGVSGWTWEPIWNFKPHPLFNPQGSLALIPLTIIEYKCLVFLYCYSPAVRIEPETSRSLSLRSFGNQCL